MHRLTVKVPPPCCPESRLTVPTRFAGHPFLRRTCPACKRRWRVYAPKPGDKAGRPLVMRDEVLSDALADTRPDGSPRRGRIDLRKYEVTIYTRNTPWGPTRCMKVVRRNGQDRITWDAIQALKNHYAGEDACFVEFFPPADQLVNEINMRHLWEVPGGWPPLSNAGRDSPPKEFPG